MATNCKKKKAGVPGAEFIENDGTHCLEDIDCTSKNKFLWRWLAVKDDNNDYFSKYVRKLKKDGVAWCLYCKEELKYNNKGRGALARHHLLAC